MLLLAFDTATPAVTVALHDGARVLAESTEVDARRHGELLVPSVHRVLERAGAALGDVTDLVVGVGPGPYTGLRVGLVTAAAFSDALGGVPVHGLCTLDGIAYAAGLSGPSGASEPGDPGALLSGPFVVATDARRKEVYWARYDDPRTRTGDPSVDRPSDIAREVADLPSVGAGALLYPEAFPGAVRSGPEHQSAAALASLAAERLAAGGAFLPALPLYLRRPDAKVPAGYKAVLPR